VPPPKHARAADCGPEEAKIAIKAANDAFPAWADTPPVEKARLFMKAAEIVRRRRGEIAEILARETGSTIPFSMFQQDLVVTALEQAANWVYLPKGEVLQSNLPNTHSIGVRRPLGVVASFTPWNGANILSWRAVLNPLAAGCTVVVKPSEFAPISAGIMVAGRTLKRTVLELGGYNPMIVLDDVDVDYAVRMATFGSFFHQGQICLNTRKIIVQRGIYEEFVAKLVERAKTLVPGDPLDPKTNIGPLITEAAVQLVDERVKEAVSLGASLRTGGTYDGLVYQPTILTDVPYTATASNEETFGPLVIVEAVDTPEEAVAVANRVGYGLTSSILARDTYKALELAPKILHGIVNVNSPTINDEIHAPMGGVRDSGWGRTGPDSLADFTDVIWINATSSERQFPF
jgi:acyl-CoA reductase-like NAD-dependent aldehyde dehydrogenase